MVWYLILVNRHINNTYVDNITKYSSWIFKTHEIRKFSHILHGILEPKIM